MQDRVPNPCIQKLGCMHSFCCWRGTTCAYRADSQHYWYWQYQFLDWGDGAPISPPEVFGGNHKYAYEVTHAAYSCAFGLCQCLHKPQCKKEFSNTSSTEGCKCSQWFTKVLSATKGQVDCLVYGNIRNSAPPALLWSGTHGLQIHISEENTTVLWDPYIKLPA